MPHAVGDNVDDEEEDALEPASSSSAPKPSASKKAACVLRIRSGEIRYYHKTKDSTARFEAVPYSKKLRWRGPSHAFSYKSDHQAGCCCM